MARLMDLKWSLKMPSGDWFSTSMLVYHSLPCTWAWQESQETRDNGAEIPAYAADGCNLSMDLRQPAFKHSKLGIPRINFHSLSLGKLQFAEIWSWPSPVNLGNDGVFMETSSPFRAKQFRCHLMPGPSSTLAPIGTGTRWGSPAKCPPTM